MTRWRIGEAEVERLVAAGELQRVAGAAADGEAWVEKARVTLGTAARVAEMDPASAYTLAYDAVRHACTGLLVHQGLRPTTTGGHVAVERAMGAQFGAGFASYGTLRRRRHELEYPAFADDLPDAEEVTDALATAASMVGAAERLLPLLGLF